MFYFDLPYLVAVGVCIVLALWAQARVKMAFARYSQEPTRRGMTGAQVAEGILRHHGIEGVKIEPVAGSLSDHYDPKSRTLRLSEPVYGSSSMAAVGIAAHEVGHAIQHATGYAALQFRSAWVPLARTGGGLSFIVIVIALMLGGASTALGLKVAWAGVGLFGLTTIFTLVTLPVELDASRRALVALSEGGYVSREEHDGAKAVLDAAALTYVAAAVSSLIMLLYWAYSLGLLGSRRD